MSDKHVKGVLIVVVIILMVCLGCVDILVVLIIGMLLRRQNFVIGRVEIMMWRIR
jgi:hypothetical protein